MLSQNEDHERRRLAHAGKTRKRPQKTLAQARANHFVTNWQDYQPPVPSHMGVHVLESIDLESLVPYIDWMPFFNAWEFHGRFPDILSDAVVGEAARALYADGQAMLGKIVTENWLHARAVLGFFAAQSVDKDDIAVFADDGRQLTKLHHLRQQRQLRSDMPHACLADFVAPMNTVDDYIGAFAVCAGFGIEEHLERFEADHDDYSGIMLKVLADRLAEAAAEFLHARTRQQYWGYAPGEALDNAALIAEKYRGIRPAPGYPACPDHTEKDTLWNLLAVEDNIGLKLTESFAMYPTAAVSGWYFSHPESRYFAVGKIAKDQVEDYARRKGISVAEAERWLAPNLGYDHNRQSRSTEAA